TTSTVRAAAAVVLQGASGTTVTVSLKNKAGAALAGKVVGLIATLPGAPSGASAYIAVSPVSARTDAAGVASFSVTDLHTGVVTYTAVDETDSVGVGLPVRVSFIDPYVPDPT